MFATSGEVTSEYHTGQLVPTHITCPPVCSHQCLSNCLLQFKSFLMPLELDYKNMRITDFRDIPQKWPTELKAQVSQLLFLPFEFVLNITQNSFVGIKLQLPIGANVCSSLLLDFFSFSHFLSHFCSFTFHILKKILPSHAAM